MEHSADGTVSTPGADALYCMPIFWALLQDDSHVSSPELAELANVAFRETLAEPSCAKYRAQYLYLCMENFKAHRSVPQSLSIALYIWSLVNGDKSIHALPLKDWVGQLNKDYPLVELTLKSCEYYMRAVDAAMEKQQPAAPGQAKQEMGERVIVGKHKHGLSLECRLKFLHAALCHGPKEIRMGSDNLLRLWSLYVETCRSDYDTRLFLQWLSNEKKGATSPSATFDKDETRLLFDLVCRARDRLAKTYDLCYYRCFAKHFKLVNAAVGAVEVRKERVRLGKLETIVGLDALWDNASYETNEEARTRFCDLLIDVYTNLQEGLLPKRKEILAVFIDRCMVSIIKSDAERDELKIANLTRLILQLLNLVEGTKYVEDDEGELAPLRPYVIAISLASSTAAKKFEVGADITVGQLRRQIADTFRLPFDGFTMYSKTRTYEREDNDSMLRVVGWSQQIQVKRTAPETEAGDSPKLLVAQNHDYIATMFLLLSKESAQFVEPVWELLMTLPQDQKMLLDIKTLNVPAAKEVRTIVKPRYIGRMECAAGLEVGAQVPVLAADCGGHRHPTARHGVGRGRNCLQGLARQILQERGTGTSVRGADKFADNVAGASAHKEVLCAADESVAPNTGRRVLLRAACAEIRVASARDGRSRSHSLQRVR